MGQLAFILVFVRNTVPLLLYGVCDPRSVDGLHIWIMSIQNVITIFLSLCTIAAFLIGSHK